MLERTIVRKNEACGVIKEMGKDVFYPVRNFVMGNFVIPTYFRYQGETNIVAEFPQSFQTMAGIASFFANSMNLGLIISGENNYSDMLATPSAIWLATNLASAGYEIYRNKKQEIKNKRFRTTLPIDEVDSLSVDELAQKYIELDLKR